MIDQGNIACFKNSRDYVLKKDLNYLHKKIIGKLKILLVAKRKTRYPHTSLVGQVLHTHIHWRCIMAPTTAGNGSSAKIPTANLLPCVAHGKRHTANRRRQIGHLPCAIYRAHGINVFRKLILKIDNKKNLIRRG